MSRSIAVGACSLVWNACASHDAGSHSAPAASTSSSVGASSGAGQRRGSSDGDGALDPSSSSDGGHGRSSSSGSGVSSSGSTSSSQASSGGTNGGASSSSQGNAASSGSPPDASSGFTCNLILGVSATGEWINQGGFFDRVDGTRWEAVTKEHEYVELWADPNDPIWVQGFDPDSGAPHRCAASSQAPDRIVWVVFAATDDATYNDYANPGDVKVLANWESILEKGVTTIRSKYPSVRRIEIMTMIRGPGTNGPGTDCMPPATSNHEDIVEPWVDGAIAAVARTQSSLVFAAPNFYVGDCAWFNAEGPHFVPSGRPASVAGLVAAYYNANP